MGGRLHSIDVILGFSKDQDPLLNPVGPAEGHKDDGVVLVEQGKQVTSDPFAHLPSMSENSHQASYHGEEIVFNHEHLILSKYTMDFFLLWVIVQK